MFQACLLLPGREAPAPATPRALQPRLTLLLDVPSALSAAAVGHRAVIEGMLCSALALLKEEMGLWLCSNASAKHLRQPEQ